MFNWWRCNTCVDRYNDEGLFPHHFKGWLKMTIAKKKTEKEVKTIKIKLLQLNWNGSRRVRT